MSFASSFFVIDERRDKPEFWRTGKLGFADEDGRLPVDDLQGFRNIVFDPSPFRRFTLDLTGYDIRPRSCERREMAFPPFAIVEIAERLEAWLANHDGEPAVHRLTRGHVTDLAAVFRRFGGDGYYLRTHGSRA